MICLRLRKISMQTTPGSKETGTRLKMRTRKIAKTATKKTTMAMPVETMAADLAIVLAVIMLAEKILAEIMLAVPAIPAEIMLAVPAATTANLAAIMLAEIRTANLASSSISLKREQRLPLFINNYHLYRNASKIDKLIKKIYNTMNLNK